jgi:hypothetical protein
VGDYLGRGIDGAPGLRDQVKVGAAGTLGLGGFAVCRAAAPAGGDFALNVGTFGRFGFFMLVSVRC